ncbi:MAG: hypothetical protein ACFFF4_15280 [Candidatus Thorarchaeota archaeon]
MPRNVGDNSPVCTAIMIFIVIIGVYQTIMAMPYYPVSNPVQVALYLVVFVGVPVISFIAWWFVGYHGRPINPTPTYPLMDDPKYQGYQDREFRDREYQERN